MENKAHAMAAGIFVVLVTALLVGLAAWLTRDTGIRDIDAFTAYLQKREQAGKPAGFEKPQGRFERVK